MKKTAYILFLVVIFCRSMAQTVPLSYPSISPPLPVPLTLSGTFCELRNTHFHAGVDLRTDGKEGMKVYAVEKGFISRIRVSGSGYGNALYIDHPNGYTSVYGHLQQFNSELNAFVKKLQYHLEQNEIDTVLPADLFPVKKQQLIALSGNTGGSQAPHLHFEMRETITEAPVNPKLFGLFIIDNLPPVPKQMMFYSLENFHETSEPKKLSLVSKGKYFGLQNDTLKVNALQLGMAIQTDDRMEDSDNNNGIHELIMKANGKTVFRFAMNHLQSFDDVRYVLAHMDHRTNKISGQRFHRCFKLPGNHLHVYEDMLNNGVLEMAHGDVKKIDITVSDLCKNNASVSFFIQCDSNANFFKHKTTTFDTLLDFSKENVFQAEDLLVVFRDSSFYNHVQFSYSKNPPIAVAKAFSDIHKVHTDLEPVHRLFDIAIVAKKFPDYLRDKALAVRENHKGSRFAHIGEWQHDSIFTFRAKDFGKFYVSIDTTPPVISPVNIYANKLMTSERTVRFKISDNLSGIAAFDLYINGKWVVMEYDAKSNSIWHVFEKSLEQGTHELVLVVKDKLNNTQTFKTKFRR